MKPESESPNKMKPPRRRLSRRRLLEAGAVSLLGGFVSSLAPASPRRRGPTDLAPLLPRLREMRAELQRRVRPWALGVAGGAMARNADRPEDRHTYTVDVAQLMWCFAMAGDLDAYLALRQFAVDHLILDGLERDPFVRGFVLWRHNPGQKPDASGTTEALRIARALWTGAARFGRPEDADLALLVLDGYGRHAATDNGIWLIRNYFNFGQSNFATNSFLIDYDPDLLREVAAAVRAKDPARAAGYADLADKSYDVMRRAVAPCGLLYDLIQPELKTLYFDINVSFFSPNDVIQLNNACTTAATVAAGDPAVGMGVLAFALPRADALYVQYYGRTGETVRGLRISAPELAALTRLAALLGHRAATVLFVSKGIPYWERVVSSPPVGDAWMTSEVLLAMQTVLDAKW